MSHRRTWPCAALLLLLPAVAAGEVRRLTLEDALALARERDAEILLAAARVEEARARLAFAGRRLQDNPVLEIAAGPRRGAGEESTDLEAGLEQELGSGGRRAARRAGAEAALARAEAERALAERRLRREVTIAFAEAVLARERLAFRTQDREAVDGLLAATERRHDAGEATALERNRARTAAAAARAEELVAAADRTGSEARLQALAGIAPGEEIEPAGGPQPPPAPPLAALLARLDERPDLRALAAELREAEAELALGRALARPAYGVRGGYEREEGADVVTAGVAVALPWVDRGQTAAAAGRARADALRRALATARAQAEAELRNAAAALAARLAAARELERTALPGLADSAELAAKSLDAGEIDLGEFLLLRREILEVRLIYLDRLRDAALASADLAAAAGGMP
jgi:cobalt-zinc-cadmium efflux system outer membrane protein